MAKTPRLWYRVDFQEGVNNTLSYVSPYDTCTITFNSNVHIKKFYARATKGDAEWGVDIGTLIAEYTNRDANTNISFDLNANQHLTQGAGEYRIGLYLQNDDGIWNLDELFIVTNNGGSKFITDNQTTLFYSGMTAKLYTMTITISNGCIIDLSPLKGLSDTKIVWGDGTTTHKGLTHTYSAGGTYQIQGNFTDVVQIADFFMNNNTNLTSIDLSQLTKVGRIGSSVFKGCTNLTNITTTSMSTVVVIGDDFLAGCTGLTTFNFQHFTSCNKVGSGFLYNCSNLTSIDLSEFNCDSDTSINNLFLYGCSSLTSIDLSSLGSLTKIPNNFLNECSGITSISMTSFTSLLQIGNNFLAGCTGLTSFNIQNNTTIKSIGSQFLNRCSNITNLYPPVDASWTWISIPSLASWGILSSLANIYCGSMCDNYKYANVWKEKENLMRSTLS